MFFENSPDLANDKDAQMTFKSIRAAIDQLDADQDRHSDEAAKLRKKDPGSLTVDDVNKGLALNLESFQLNRRELAIRKRIRDEWHPLQHPARLEAQRRRQAAAINAEPIVIAKVRDGLLNLGFTQAQSEAAFFLATVNAHPEVRAARAEIEAANASFNTPEPKGDITHNDGEISRLERLIATQHQSLLSA